MEKKKTLTRRLIGWLCLVLVCILTAFSSCSLGGGKDEENGLTGKILEGSFVFDEDSTEVKLESGCVYSTDEVLLLEVNVNGYGLIKLVFEKSEKADARGAYRYDVLTEASGSLAVDHVSDGVTVTADIYVTTTSVTSYKLYTHTYETESAWTKNY